MAFDFGAAAEMLKSFSVLMAIVMTAYAGFRLITCQEVQQRDEWKEVLSGIAIGLVLLYLAPLIASQLTGGTYCSG